MFEIISLKPSKRPLQLKSQQKQLHRQNNWLLLSRQNLYRSPNQNQKFAEAQILSRWKLDQEKSKLKRLQEMVETWVEWEFPIGKSETKKEV